MQCFPPVTDLASFFLSSSNTYAAENYEVYWDLVYLPAQYLWVMLCQTLEDRKVVCICSYGFYREIPRRF